MKPVSKATLTEVTCHCVQGHTSVPAVSSGGAWGTNNGNAFDSVPATIAVDREAGVSSLDSNLCTCRTHHVSAKFSASAYASLSSYQGLLRLQPDLTRFQAMHLIWLMLRCMCIC